MNLAKENIFLEMTEGLIRRLESSEKVFTKMSAMYVAILSKEKISHTNRKEFMKHLEVYHKTTELIVADFGQFVPLREFFLPAIPPDYQLEGKYFESIMTLYLETLFLAIESFEKMLNHYCERLK